MKYLLLLLLLSGCSQRIVQIDIQDPNGVNKQYYYQSNSVASDTSADVVRIVFPTGLVIEVGGAVQDNDSIQILTPWGWLETERE